MKTHTTNYQNTFIAVAADCPVQKAEIPPENQNIKSIARLQYELIENHPYQFTSDEALFEIYAIRKTLNNSETEISKQNFFSKGQACMRSSPLCKRYGWGIHFNSEGKMALYGVHTLQYIEFINDQSLKILFAMKTKKEPTK